MPIGNREPKEQGPPVLFDYDRFELPANTALEIYLAPHQTEGDLPPESELRQIMREADIIILEAEGGDFEWETKILNRLSKGDYSAYQKTVQEWAPHAHNTSWKQAFYRSLYDAKTPITIADLPEGHPLVSNRARIVGEFHTRAFLEDFDEAVQGCSRLWVQRMDAMSRRDQYILEHLAPAIEAVVANNPKLTERRQDSRLQVAMFYGGEHISLFDALAHKSTLVEPNGFTVIANTEKDSMPIAQYIYANYLRGVNPGPLDMARLMLVHVLSSIELAQQPRDSQESGGDIETRLKELILPLDYEELRDLRAEAVADFYQNRKE